MQYSKTIQLQATIFIWVAPKNPQLILLDSGKYHNKHLPGAGIYPNSFTNAHFWTKIEFLNVVKCR